MTVQLLTVSMEGANQEIKRSDDPSRMTPALLKASLRLFPSLPVNPVA